MDNINHLHTLIDRANEATRDALKALNEAREALNAQNHTHTPTKTPQTTPTTTPQHVTDFHNMVSNLLNPPKQHRQPPQDPETESTDDI